MPSLSGKLSKLHSNMTEIVEYALPVDDDSLPLNPLIGKSVTLVNEGTIACHNCGRETKKSFNQGYCFPCSQRLARCDICIVRPERCHYDKGTCREPDWGEQHCLQPHIVYLAVSSGLKVGITRQTQVPTRWIDQGAGRAMPILRVSSRLQAGLVETTIARHVADKTNWRTMLKTDSPPVDLPAERDRLLALCAAEIEDLRHRFGADVITGLPDAKPVDIRYPVTRYPDTVRSLNLDKTPEIEGTLTGIKGQYLIFDSGVINVRKYTAYHVTVSY